MKEEISFRKCLDYLINQSKNVLLPYDEVIKLYPNFVFNTICDEIAEDWDNKYYINRLFDNKLIGIEIKKLYDEIDNNFLIVSKGMPNYDEKIWKTESIMNHPFWIEQKTKIKQFLSLLMQVKI